MTINFSLLTMMRKEFQILSYVRRRDRLCKPREHSLIINKLLGKRLSFPILMKVEQAWARSANIRLIDISNDFYMVKLGALEDYDFDLTGDPWLTFYHYLAVRKWEPTF